MRVARRFLHATSIGTWMRVPGSATQYRAGFAELCRLKKNERLLVNNDTFSWIVGQHFLKVLPSSSEERDGSRVFFEAR